MTARAVDRKLAQPLFKPAVRHGVDGVLHALGGLAGAGGLLFAVRALGAGAVDPRDDIGKLVGLLAQDLLLELCAHIRAQPLEMLHFVQHLQPLRLEFVELFVDSAGAKRGPAGVQRAVQPIELCQRTDERLRWSRRFHAARTASSAASDGLLTGSPVTSEGVGAPSCSMRESATCRR